MSSIPITSVRPTVHRPAAARPAAKDAAHQHGKLDPSANFTPVLAGEQIDYRQGKDEGRQRGDLHPILRAKLSAVSHGATSLHPLARRGRVNTPRYSAESSTDSQSAIADSNVTSITSVLSAQGEQSDSHLGGEGRFANAHLSGGKTDETSAPETSASNSRAVDQAGKSAVTNNVALEIASSKGELAQIEDGARYRQDANERVQQVYLKGMAGGFSTAAIMQAMLHHYGVEQFPKGLQTLRQTLLDNMGAGIHSRNKVLMSAQLFGVRTCVRLTSSLKRCQDLLERFHPAGTNNHILSVNLLQQVVNCTMQGVNANQVGAMSKLLIGNRAHQQAVALNAVYFMFKQQLPLVMWKNENSRYQALQSLEQILAQYAGIDRANRISLSMTASGVPR